MKRLRGAGKSTALSHHATGSFSVADTTTFDRLGDEAMKTACLRTSMNEKASASCLLTVTDRGLDSPGAGTDRFLDAPGNPKKRSGGDNVTASGCLLVRVHKTGRGKLGFNRPWSRFGRRHGPEPGPAPGHGSDCRVRRQRSWASLRHVAWPLGSWPQSPYRPEKPSASAE